MFNGNPEPVPFPGIDDVPNSFVFRSMGQVGGEGLGVGFLHKNGVRIDFVDQLPLRYVMVLVLRGRGTYIDGNGRHFEVGPGDLFQRVPGKSHSDYIDPESEWCECFLEFGVRFFQSLSAMGILRPETPVLPRNTSPELPELVWEFVHKLGAASDAGLPELAGEMLKLIAFAQQRNIARDGTAEFDVIDLACRKLGTGFERPFDLQSFCRRHGCGYEHFRKLFKQRLGVSPWQYRIKRRLDAATAMLHDRSRSIGEIADALGYSSTYEFSAQFKRAFGIAPGFFRDGKKIRK